jgi:type II secretory ATPase GspE/PulE/Tfp pilus assembly ATPase PilB-like protein
MSQDQPKLKELVCFWRQFGLLISSGVPILEALNVIRAEITMPGLRDAIERIHDSIQHGKSMSAGLARSPELFSQSVIILCRAGEAGGVLDKIAERIANGLETGALAASGPAGTGPAEPQAEEAASGPTIVERVAKLIEHAFTSRASDIHLEPTAKGGRVRLRIDGVMQPTETLGQDTYNAVMSRLMVMANVDVAERRIPQDGRILVRSHGRDLDLRCSFASFLVDGPAGRNTSAVLRLLDRQAVVLDIEQLGASGETLAKLKAWPKQPNGIYVVTGPTGSGKTTLLYSLLCLANKAECKVLTAENPVEYLIGGVLQAEVRDNIGVTFPRLVRSFLRQDPDVILVGEIRDRETAMVLVQASLTGHLVFTTLHTNDAAAVSRRLVDIGIEPWLVLGSLGGAAAIRLIRRVCPNCSEPCQPENLDALSGLPDESDLRKATFVRGRGCDKCAKTGYRGRTAIVEVLPLTAGVRDLIARNADPEDIRGAAIAAGMVTMRHDGLRKAAQGVTTLEEVLLVTQGMR